MSDPFDLVVSRLESHHLRMNGPARGRASCPSCGGANRSKLSVGRGDTGAVLLQCWAGCSVEQVAHALGLDLTDLFPPRPVAHRNAPVLRRHLLTASQALALLDAQLTLAVVVSADLARGEALPESTRDCLVRGAARVAMLRQEVLA